MDPVTSSSAPLTSTPIAEACCPRGHPDRDSSGHRDSQLCTAVLAQPPLPEWGALISSGRRFIYDQWRVATAPGFAIFIVSLAFNLPGDALRILLDPPAFSCRPHHH